GLRAWGASSGFDYDLEAAYQFGNADAVGSMFPVTNMLGTYGDDEAEFSSWAGDLEVGYKFDVKWAPRVFVGANYFGGEDNRDITFLEWLNPLAKSNASVSFNRLFSGIWYTSVLDILNAAANLSNFWSLRYGFSVAPSETITAGLFATYFATVDEFAWSPYFSGINGKRAPYFPGLSFITNSDTPDDIGTVSHLWMRYAYSPSLWIKIGWEHLFSGDAVYDGSFVKQNGLDLMAGSDDADADYLYFDTEIKF
ncbi:MAG: hypothetical protein QG656_2393, partial [Candidatus Hydrogenedentes bacterium]|nr:hypothetical protein [Candidatus Hydrogenedentota bacterium]